MVPDGHGAVRPGRGEGVVDGVEGERVDGPYVVDVIDRLAVEFEGVFCWAKKH